MAFGDDELVFKYIDGKVGYSAEHPMGDGKEDKCLFSIMRFLQSEFFLGVFSASSAAAKTAGGLAKGPKDSSSLSKLVKSIVRKADSELEVQGLDRDFVKSVYPHYLAASVLGISDDHSSFRNCSGEKRIDFIYKKDDKIVIKKLVLDSKTTPYQFLFHISSIIHSISSLLSQGQGEHVQFLESLPAYGLEKLYPLPNLFMFSKLKLPAAEEKKFKKILKKVLGKSRD